MIDEFEWDDVQIREYFFELTCIACPEQYDVYIGDLQIAYVRLRGGNLYATHPDVGGRQIYYHHFENDEWKGCFDTLEEREFHLTKIADELDKIK